MDPKTAPSLANRCRVWPVVFTNSLEDEMYTHTQELKISFGKLLASLRQENPRSESLSIGLASGGEGYVQTPRRECFKP